MRFYGMTFIEVRALPIKAFWTVHAMIDRLRAEEILDWLPAFGSAMTDKDGIKRIVDQLTERVGNTLVAEQMERTPADTAKLRHHFG